MGLADGDGRSPPEAVILLFITHAMYDVLRILYITSDNLLLSQVKEAGRNPHGSEKFERKTWVT
jgi:hypothetical protein